jgi:hypothetical protein
MILLLGTIADDWEYLHQSITLFNHEEDGVALNTSGLFQSIIPRNDLVKVLCHQHRLLTTFKSGSHL